MKLPAVQLPSETSLPSEHLLPPLAIRPRPHWHAEYLASTAQPSRAFEQGEVVSLNEQMELHRVGEEAMSPGWSGALGHAWRALLVVLSELDAA